MNYSFEYIDIILLAMIAGFIFLRLRGILGKRSGFEGKAPPQFQEVLKNINPEIKTNQNEKFDDDAQKEFLKGAKIAYETIITNFSKGSIKDIKSLASRKSSELTLNALTKRNNTLIGANSTILPYLKIGSNCIIGAGTVVTKNIKSGTIYFNKK